MDSSLSLQRELRTLSLYLPKKYSGVIVEVIDNRNYLHPWFWFENSKRVDQFCKEANLELETFEGRIGKIKIKNGTLHVYVGDKQEFVDEFEYGMKLIVIETDKSPRFYNPKV